jgi:His-Xaa-Ser system radical SAM maturase HxsB
LLPFRFGQLEGDDYLLTNDVGEYVVLQRAELADFIDHSLLPDTSTYRSLKAKHFLFDDENRSALDLLALKYRTRLARLAAFTGLHIFVVTLRCDHSCHYCQVSRQTEHLERFDMTREHAEKALAFAFRSPSPNLKIEFQGGEPLLNFDLVRYVVERATSMNAVFRKNLQFVIATNLSRLSHDVLAFCKEHAIYLSTSLDGPADLHDAHRPVRGGGSHRRTVEAIREARAALGADRLAALMTTTVGSLARVEEIVDEYVRLEFHSIFLRSISPYGFAVRASLRRKYDVHDWVRFYERGLAHILRINQSGYALREEFTAILLQKLLHPAGTSYVDLQSPAGIGIGVLVYNYDGSVYASDEGRMLAEMGDHSFRLGHLDADSYETMMTSDALLSVLDSTMLEGVPMCTDCPFLPYCGADPVYHQATQQDVVGHKALSDFCKKQMGVLRHLIRTLEDDPPARDILMTWV